MVRSAIRSFRRDDPPKLLTAAGVRDVLRNPDGIAIIGDPRNDSHIVISQMHLAFVEAHNRFADRARESGLAETDVFARAARELRWHYQRVMLREFLPSLIGHELTNTLLNEGRRFYVPEGEPFIPLEFADAAYRYGHSQIRHQYRINGTSEPAALFPDLIGFRPVPPASEVEWSFFFDAPDRPPAQRAITGESQIEESHSLAMRDLQRGQGVGLPSGEAVARRLGERPLPAEEVGAIAAGWRGETPLWYYILREAAARTDGDRLGPVGGRIVGEVLIGLLDLDATSVRYAPEDWKPEPRSRSCLPLRAH